MCDHLIDWDSAKVLDKEQEWHARKVKEALHISRQGCKHPLMNKDSGWAMSVIWKKKSRCRECGVLCGQV